MDDSLKVFESVDKVREEELSGGRATGKSTRLIDFYIQELFNKKEIFVIDHDKFGENKYANNDLLDKIMRRLHSEHYRITKYLTVNRGKNSIKLNDRS